MSARWTSEKELAGLILAKAGKGETVRLSPETAKLIAHKLLKHNASDPHLKSLGFRLELWDNGGRNVAELLAAAQNYGLIRVIFEKVRMARPNERFLVRQGTRIVLDSGEPDPETPSNVVQLR
ncbi:MAG: hypothetical protein ABJJ37_26985 [Roseibium sp.]